MSQKGLNYGLFGSKIGTLKDKLYSYKKGGIIMVTIKKLVLLSVVLFTSSVAFGMEEKKEAQEISGTYFSQLPQEIKVDVLVGHLKTFVAQQERDNKDISDLKDKLFDYAMKMMQLPYNKERERMNAEYAEYGAQIKTKLQQLLLEKIEDLKRNNDFKDVINSDAFKTKINLVLEQIK